MQRGQQWDDEFEDEDYGDDDFEFGDEPSEEELDALEKDMLKSGDISKDEVIPKFKPIKDIKKLEHTGPHDVASSQEFTGVNSLNRTTTRGTQRKDADAVAKSHQDWVKGVPSAEDPDDSEKDTYPWPKPFIDASMKAQRGHPAREHIQKHLMDQGLVRDVDGVNMVTLRRVGKPSVGVTNASYLPNWGENTKKDGSYSSGGYGQPEQQNPETAGTWEWDVPLHHILGHGMGSEGEVFAIHHPSIQPRRIAGP